MCRVCKAAVQLPKKEALDRIGAAMGSGRDPEHFQKVLDQILGTGVPEQDEVADEAWENRRRS